MKERLGALLALFGLVLVVAGVPMLLVGIWIESWQWAVTAPVSVVSGVFLCALSNDL